ncbi:MAG TPA: hypothetical protein VJU61_07175 [Polyangiaceae bacterium]|nr:hypothetical protein [Polyangiaceae bacterium]
MKSVIITALGLILFPIGLGCSPAGTQPHAMSATGHEAAASQEQQAGEAHDAQYQPGASATKTACRPVRGANDVCWTSLLNPTAEHSEEAEQHRTLAAQHRAASEALRTAEASACSGISEEDRDMSPFAHREDIRSVSPLKEDVRTGKVAGYRLAGVEVVFRAVPGMTAEWLQRLMTCHLARNAAVGHAAAGADMPYCPLTLSGAQASVRSVGDGFAVDIRSNDDATARQIQQRSESLKLGPVAAK